jgi:NAD(P)-dependent dehydrogenase (short-subunit alcohol dehydrogenase family)
MEVGPQGRNSPMFDAAVLKGKRILITGGGTGLGKEMAVGFARHGAHVYICGRRKEVLDQAAQEIPGRSGGQATALLANVREPDSIEAMMGSIWADGPLSGLVNNAAANFLAPTESLSPRGYEAVRSTVMDGSFYASLACGKRWIAAGLPGVIVSNLVTWVWTGSAYVVPSAMAKAAVHAMTCRSRSNGDRKASASMQSHPGRSRPKGRGTSSIHWRRRASARLKPMRYRCAASAGWTNCAIS